MELEIKKGESILNATIRRSVAGITVTAKASRIIEEYFTEHARGARLRDVTEWDRSWVRDKDYPALHVYHVPDESPFQRVISLSEGGYTLATPGGPLIQLAGPGRGEVINLSWLRLQGISTDAGIKFSVKGVFTEKQVKQITTRTQEGVRRFFLDYLRPVNVTILLTTQEAATL